ncbi:MAG: HEAT repeat domain-containing protein [Planctomycetota bacterium]
MHRFQDVSCLCAMLGAAIVGALGAAPPAQPPAAADAPPAVDAESLAPAVRAVLASEPQTPAALIRAGKTLSELEQPELARQMLAQALAAGIDDTQAIALHDEFGSAVFIALAGRADLQPEAKQLSDAVLGAVNRRLEDPQYLATLVQQLRSPSAAERDKAAAGLLAARQAAVAPLVATLTAPDQAEPPQAARIVLLQLRGDAVDPLIAMLDSPDARTATEAARLLGTLRAAKASPYLLRPALDAASPPEVQLAAQRALKLITGGVPTADTAVEALALRSRDYFAGKAPVEDAVLGQVAVWSWDPQSQKIVRTTVPAAEVTRQRALRFARDAHALSPASDDLELLYLAALLDDAAYRQGLNQPLPAETPAARALAQLDSAKAERLLAFVLDNNHPAAAAAVLRAVAGMDDALGLLYGSATPGPLAQALLAPDRRVRLAAAEAIVKLQPVEPYAGSSQLPTALSYFVPVTGKPQALVVGPNTAENQNLAGLLAGAGYGAVGATNGREALELAVAAPELELALIDVATSYPRAAILVQHLRRDPRTAGVRIGLTAEAGRFAEAEEIALGDPLVMPLYRPLDEKMLAQQLARLETLKRPEFVPHAERVTQAGTAIGLLAQLADSPPKLYELRRLEGPLLKALYVPELGTQAAATLARLPSVEAQRALVNLASLPTQPIELREAALQAFITHRLEHGLLLTHQEILEQYDRYNQSEKLDQATQQVLSAILDCIEAGLPKTPAPTPTAQSSATK